MRHADTDHQSTAAVLPGATLPVAALARPLQIDAPAESLSLRPLAPEDRAAFIDVVRRSREHLDNFCPLHLPGETDDQLFERQLLLTEKGERSGAARRRMAWSDGRLIGAFNLISISRGLEWSADLSCWVSAGEAGRGLASCALRMVSRQALDDLPDGLGLQLIRAYVQRDNEAATRLVRRVGFQRQQEGRTRLQTGAAWKLHDLWTLTR